MYHIFYIQSSVEGHLGSFQLLTIINKAASKRVVHVCLFHVVTFSGNMALERLDLALEGSTRTEKKERGDWRMGGEKKVYGTFGEGGIWEKGNHLECKQRI